MRKVHTLVVGGGPGGLSAATALAQAGREVLLIEKNPAIGPKLCAGYLPFDADARRMEIPAPVIEKIHRERIFHFGERRLQINDEPRITFSRIELGQAMLHQAKGAGVVVETGRRLRGWRGREARVDDEAIEFSYLIGADGSNSTVRRGLDLPVRSFCVAFQVALPEARPAVECFFDYPRYACWPAWLIPHRDHVVVGLGGDPRYLPLTKMKSELRELIRRLGHSPEKYPLSGSRLATDYPGHVFGNIFLVGDAAGLVEDWSGYGIYAAWASGREAAQAILGLTTRFPLIASVLAAKRRQRRLIQAMTRSPAVGRAVLGLMPAALRVLPWARRWLRSSPYSEA